MNLVVNEWLLEYSVPGASKAHHSLLLAFLDTVRASDHRMVIGRETPFTQKFYRFMKAFGGDLSFKRSFSTLFRLLFLDPGTTILVERTETKTVADEEVAGIHSDDRYLLELVRTVEDSTIVSTDNRLIEALARRPQFPIIHLEQYLSTNRRST